MDLWAIFPDWNDVSINDRTVKLPPTEPGPQLEIIRHHAWLSL